MVRHHPLIRYSDNLKIDWNHSYKGLDWIIYIVYGCILKRLNIYFFMQNQKHFST